MPLLQEVEEHVIIIVRNITKGRFKLRNVYYKLHYHSHLPTYVGVIIDLKCLLQIFRFTTQKIKLLLYQFPEYHLNKKEIKHVLRFIF